MRRIWMVVSFLLIISLLASCGGAEEPTAAPETAEAEPAAVEETAEEEPEAGGETIQLAGSTTVQPLAELMGEAFTAKTGIRVEVQGGGSSQGVTMAGEGTVDIGNASRGVKDSEFETFPDLVVHTVAYDGIAIVTHPDIKVPTLSEEQVRDIFAGEIANFSEVGGPDAGITVVSREEGSGTRAAFEELVMEYKDAAGEKQSKLIFEKALLQQSNGQVRTTVSTTPNSIGYLSFGFLDETVKQVPIDGVGPTVASVKNGSYPIFRPLNMLTNGPPSDLAQKFLDFALGPEGQAIVAEEYITVTDDAEAEGGLSGQIQLAGSTTVQPVAELLGEAFTASNPDVRIEVQGGGSSQGVTMAGEGTVDIGNASRGVKDSEFETFPDLQVHTIAFDGIAIVTHPDIELPNLSEEQVRDIFAGEITNFSEVGGPDAGITVVSREEGSGTRAAFEELVMEYKDAAGEKQAKLIFERALLQQSNGQVRTTVATTPNSVGYLSFGFLDESVKVVPIEGVEPTVANVKNASYPIFRPLNMLTNGPPNDLAQAFLDFVLSADGQAIVAEDYITVD